MKTLKPNFVIRIKQYLKQQHFMKLVGLKLEAEGCVLKPGGKLIFFESKVWVVQNDRRDLIARSSAVMATVISEKLS